MNQKSNIGILFFTMIVVMIGFGIIIPILPFYVDSYAAEFNMGGLAMGFLIAIYSVMQLIFSPIWGQLSERYGRKPILMVGVAGAAFSMLLFGLSTNLWMLFIARALGGILSAATGPAAMAYISDSTTRENRSGGMGAVGAAQGIGMVIGPGIGGWLSDKISLQAPFFLAAGLSLISLLLIFFLLPESFPQEQRAVTENKIKGLQLRPMINAIIGPLGFLFFLAFLMNFGLTSFEGIFALFAKARFNYTSKDVGIILMIVGVVSALVQGLLTGPTTRRWGESRVILASLLASAAGFILILIPTEFFPFLLAVTFFVTSNAMLRPAGATMIANRTADQGTMMGLNNSFMSLGRIAGPLWAGFLFDHNLNYPYLSSAFIMIISFICCLIWLPRLTPTMTADPEAGSF